MTIFAFQSIRTKIFLAVLTVLSAVAGVVMTSSRQPVEEAVLRAEERAVANVLALVEANIRGRYRTLLKDKVQAVQTRKKAFRDFDRVVLEALDGFAAQAERGAVDEGEARRLALDWLSRIRPVGGDFVFAFDADGRALVHPGGAPAGPDLSGLRDFKGRNVAAAARDEARRYREAYLTFAWAEPGGGTGTRFGHFVPYPRWDWIVGSVGDIGDVEAQVARQLDLLIAELSATLPDIAMAGRGIVFVFDGRGKFVVAPRKAAAGMATPDVLRRLRALAEDGGRRGDSILIAGDGEVLEGRATHLKALDWYVAGAASRDAMRAPARELVARQALIFVATLALGLLLAYLFADRISRPLNRLALYAKALPAIDFTAAGAGGDLSSRLPVHRRDELGRLAEAFVFMEGSLHRNVRSLMEATAARQRIEGELGVARDIQLGMLPKLFPPFPDRPEIDLHAVLVSAKEVGGDLFDYYFLDDRRLCFTIGDVAGKGVPAALFMAVTKTLIKAAAEREPDPAAMLARANDEVSRDNPNAIFVTLLIGILDIATGEIRYANAGHNPPVVMRGDGATELLRPISGPAAGVMEDIDFAPLGTRLAPGDTLLLYTDGVTEAMDTDGVLYGMERLLSRLDLGTAAGSEALVNDILADVKAHAGNAEQSDDITILALRFRGMTRCT